MNTQPRAITILLADDDAEDRILAEDALRECGLADRLRFVENGEELLAYLRRQGRYAGPGAAPRPGLILLDLNMPRMDGREALRALKADPALRRIPVVVMTTSKAEEDIYRTYDLGVSSYVAKPVSFEALVGVMRAIGLYWFDTVLLPDCGRPGEARA